MLKIPRSFLKIMAFKRRSYHCARVARQPKKERKY